MLTAGTKLKGQNEMSEIGHDGSKAVNFLVGAGDLFLFNIGIAERGNVDIKGYIVFTVNFHGVEGRTFQRID